MENIRVIRNEADLDWALAEVAPYFEKEPEPGTPESNRFEILTTLIEAYEDKYWAIPANVDPVAVLDHAMEHLGKTRNELVEILGSRGRASEILAKKRALSIEMIRAISKAWKLPVELLIQPYKLKTAPIKAASKVAAAKGQPKSAKTKIKKRAA